MRRQCDGRAHHRHAGRRVRGECRNLARGRARLPRAASAGGSSSCSRHERVPALRAAGRVDLSLPAALPVLLEPDRLSRRARGWRPPSGSASSGKRRRSASCTSGFPAANRSCGGTWRNWSPGRARRVLYTNLITSAVGLDEDRAGELREAGLDSAQISFQADEAARGGPHRRGAGARAQARGGALGPAKRDRVEPERRAAPGHHRRGCRKSSRSPPRSARRGWSWRTCSITAGAF